MADDNRTPIQDAGTLQIASALRSPPQPSAEPICLLLNLAALGSVGLLLISPSDPLPLFLFVACTVGYWLYAGFHPALKYLWNLNPVEDVVDYIKRIERASPAIRFHGECYHFEQKTRWVTETYTEYESRYDFQSKSTSSVPVTKTRQVMETYRERVVTHAVTEEFKFTAWDDRTRALSDAIYRYQATKVAFSMSVAAADAITNERLNAARNTFKDAHQHCDTYFDFDERVQVDGFKAKLLAIVDLDNKSAGLHWAVYVLMSLIGLCWPYLMWFERQTVQGSFGFSKFISVNDSAT